MVSYSTICNDSIYRLIHLQWSRHCQLLPYLPSFVGVCLFTSLSPCVVLLHLAPTASDEVLVDVLRRPDSIVSRCVGVTVCNVVTSLESKEMTNDEMDSIFSQYVSKFFCISLSLPCVGSSHSSTGPFQACS